MNSAHQAKTLPGLQTPPQSLQPTALNNRQSSPAWYEHYLYEFSQRYSLEEYVAARDAYKARRQAYEAQFPVQQIERSFVKESVLPASFIFPSGEVANVMYFAKHCKIEHQRNLEKASLDLDECTGCAPLEVATNPALVQQDHSTIKPSSHPTARTIPSGKACPNAGADFKKRSV